MRPDSTSPPNTPALRSRPANTILCACARIGLLDGNTAEVRGADLRHRNGEHAVDQVGADGAGVDGHGELERSRERALAALELLVALRAAVLAGPLAAHRQGAVVEIQGDVFTVEAGELHRQHVSIRQLREVHRGHPYGRA